MIKKYYNLLVELVSIHKDNYKMCKENEWANIYHDSIRGIEFIETLPLNIGRWAGNYAFFYLLNRILNDVKPNTILELGLGESSKFISRYLDNYLTNSNHLIIEHDINWKIQFLNKFNLSKKSKIQICNMITRNIEGHFINSYANILEVINIKYDFYIIDGPIGSNHYSRYDIIEIATALNPEDEFIILFDDYNRTGEKNTIKKLLLMFNEKNINVYSKIFSGNKEVMILVTKKYKYLITV